MNLIYNIGIMLLGYSMHILSLFNSKAKDWTKGRLNMFDQMPSTKNRKVIWFHCASLGEFDQTLPLMKIIKSNNPNFFILVTFFSPSGMKHYRKRKHLADHVMYLALDTKSNAEKFIKHFKPFQAFFVKYEFWSNHINEAKKNNTHIYNLCGVFRKNHLFFKWYGSFFRKTLLQFDWFFVQNKESEKLLQSIKINNVSIYGDTRYDRVIANKENVIVDNNLKTFCGKEKAFIIGSSWPKDENILLDFINMLEKKVIIAPHNIGQTFIDNIISKLKVDYVKYSEIKDQRNIIKSRVLILDTIGQLSNAYHYGNIAYIGGGFSNSLHNILEPAVFGLPVIFGPKYQRFPEAKKFIENKFGYSIGSKNELEKTFKKIEANYLSIQKKELDFISQNTGASLKIYNHIYSEIS